LNKLGKLSNDAAAAYDGISLWMEPPGLVSSQSMNDGYHLLSVCEKGLVSAKKQQSINPKIL
jgi:hypothetical protein